MKSIILPCTCGAVEIEVAGDPIIGAECCCASCRDAAARMEKLPGAPRTLNADGGTPFALYRKDRTRVVRGAGELAAFRLTDKAPTRRVIAACCNTPLFLEFQSGHWLSLYARLWPVHARPAMQLRTMTSDLEDTHSLPTDMPNARSQSAAFFGRLLWAWIAMGFRVPKVEVAKELRL